MEWLPDIDWRGLFVPTYSIAEVVLRGTLTYLSLFVILRFLLKRQTGAVGIADLLVIVLIADASQNALGREYSSVTEGVVLVLTIVAWDYALDWGEYRFTWLRSLTRPGPLLLVRNGRMLRRSMRREMITEEELRAELRKDGVDALADVVEARMEGDGKMRHSARQGESDGARQKAKAESGPDSQKRVFSAVRFSPRAAESPAVLPFDGSLPRTGWRESAPFCFRFSGSIPLEPAFGSVSFMPSGSRVKDFCPPRSGSSPGRGSTPPERAPFGRGAVR